MDNMTHQEIFAAVQAGMMTFEQFEAWCARAKAKSFSEGRSAVANARIQARKQARSWTF